MKNNIELAILVNGRPVRTYTTNKGQTIVEAREGTEYSLRVKNKTRNRIKTVITIDGINILSGKIATINKEEAGYIISGFAEEIFSGYRIDEESVASFKFTTKNKSYAKSKGNKSNAGVIGIRAYSEHIPIEVSIKKYDEWVSPENNSDLIAKGSFNEKNDPIIYYNSSNSKVNLNDNSSSINHSANLSNFNSFDMGSTFGKKVDESITFVEFEAGNLLDSIDIYYASKDGLEKLGINLFKTKNIQYPKAFQGFCKPPRGWKG